jgi:tRNA G18 (ribose-2'-O)-methylase SpoU
MLKLGAKELRTRRPTKEELAQIKRRPIYIVLDNVLDTYNVGGLFRLADAIAAEKIILCGQTETPPSSRIHKAAVGTEEWVDWSYYPTAQDGLKEIKSQKPKVKIVAIEQASGSIPYTQIPKELISGNVVTALVVGNETKGVSKNVLKMADIILEIPMFGVNKSLNVIVSAAIVAYKIVEEMEKAS